MRDHRLAYLDQATYLSLRATGRAQLAQLVWVYERPLDYAGLKVFHQNFGYGLAGRRIERSPLPFGRHRWVSSEGPAADIDIADEPRPRSELSDWIDERAQLPVDPEWGPGWHLGVLPMTDGSSAVSLVGSHCLFDGLGFFRTIAEAATGNVRELGYPPPKARTRRQALLSDALQAGRDMPEVYRALTAAARLLRQQRSAPKRPVPAPVVVAGANDNVVVPAITAFVDYDEWERTAKQLGGNSHSLLAGFSAQLAARIGRSRADDVALLIAISDRTDDDTRANALRFATVEVESERVCSDLSPARAVIRNAIRELQESSDDPFAVLPLTPFVPKRAMRRTGSVMFGDLPVSCSNVGHVERAVCQVDGTDADYVLIRPVDQNVRRADIERSGGQLVIAAGRTGAKMSIGIVAYQPGATNTKSRLRALATDVLGSFGLSGEMV